MKGLSLHKEGVYLTIINVVFLILAIIFVSKVFIYLLLLVLLFLIFTYRIPTRISPPMTVYNQFVSPVDGVVKEINIVSRPIELKDFTGDENLLRITININYWTNHMVYSPVEGMHYQIRVKSAGLVNHFKYVYHNVKDYFFEEFLGHKDSGKTTKPTQELQINGNDYMIFGIQTLDNQKVIMVHISGNVPYSYRTHVSKDEAIALGERIGLMRFGGRVEIYLPEDSYVFAYPGKTVVGGESVMGILAVNKVHHILESYREMLVRKPTSKNKSNYTTQHINQDMYDNRGVAKQRNQKKSDIKYSSNILFHKSRTGASSPTIVPHNKSIYHNKENITNRILEILSSRSKEIGKTAKKPSVAGRKSTSASKKPSVKQATKPVNKPKNEGKNKNLSRNAK